MRNVDRLPFIFAGILFLLAWLLGFPMRAQSAPLGDARCTLIADPAPKGPRTRAAFLMDLPQLVK